MLKKLVARLSNRFGPVQEGAEPEAQPHDIATNDPVQEQAAPSPMHAEDAHGAAVATEGTFDIRKVVRGRFERQLNHLREEFVVVSKESDVIAFIDRLETSDEHLVRQPPLAAQKVLTICRRPTSGLDELIHVIERDPALTQDLLQHSNSAFYASRGGNVSSLHSAVQRVGMAGVESVMMKRIVEGLMSRPGGVFDRMVGKVWPHLVRTAPIARSLAGAFGVDAERAFTLALLHDAGKLVLFDHVAALRTSLRRAPELPPVFVSAALRLLHEPLGGIAASGWGMDDDSITAIAIHHRQPPPDAITPLSEVVYLSERIDIARQTGEDVTLAKMWREGALTGSLDDATDALASIEEVS